MVVLLKIVYWAALLGAGGAIGLISFLMLFNSPRAVPFSHVAVTLCSVLASSSILWWAMQVGLTGERWVPGILTCLLAAVVFAVMMVGGFLLFAEMRWQ